jgi:methylmalonyl-CoA mutase C-terminal domain/subunit
MPTKILIAKPGLDGHDRGAKVVAHALRDAGLEVVYTGLKRTPEEIVQAAIQEDVQVVGLSVLSGAHVSLSRKVIEGLRANGASDIRVVVGGIIPPRDVETLTALGVHRVFPMGTPLPQIVAAFVEVRGAAEGEPSQKNPDTSRPEQRNPESRGQGEPSQKNPDHPVGNSGTTA